MKKKKQFLSTTGEQAEKHNLIEEKRFLHHQSFVFANLYLAQKPYKHGWKKGSVKNISPHPFN